MVDYKMFLLVKNSFFQSFSKVIAHYKNDEIDNYNILNSRWRLCSIRCGCRLEGTIKHWGNKYDVSLIKKMSIMDSWIPQVKKYSK